MNARRAFLHQIARGAMGAVTSAFIGSACKSGSAVPAQCPPTQPNCRVLAIRRKVPAGGIHNLWTTFRQTPGHQGSWSPMDFVSTNFLPAGFWDILDVDEVSVPQGSVYGCDESHAAIVVLGTPTGFPGEMLYKRQRTNGSWDAFTTLSGGLGTTFVPARPWRFSSVSLAKVNEELHVCGVTSKTESYAVQTGLLAHAMRRFNAALDAGGFELRQWTDWADIAAFTSGGPGMVVDAGCAGVKNPATGKEELHVCVVTNDGRLWHSVRTGPASWTTFGDVAAQAGSVGPFARVDCAADGNLLHVVAVSNDRRAWYTIRSVTAWRPFEDVLNAASFPLTRFDQIFDVGIGFYNDGLPTGESQLAIVATTSSGLSYTVRSSQLRAWQPVSPGGPSRWKPWANLETETAYADGGGFSAASVGWAPRAQ